MEAFDYPLPDSAIAIYPKEQRHKTRFLVFNKGRITEHGMPELETVIPQHTCFIANNSKVIPARIKGFVINHKRLELFVLHTVSKSTHAQTALCQCLVGGLKHWPQHQKLERTLNSIRLCANFISPHPKEGAMIEFKWQAAQELSWELVLETFGEIPIPPYLKRDSEAIDASRYQTVYAQHRGSVAAPTAGLHFSQHHITALIQKKHRFEWLTLHVGPGTFKPVKTPHWNAHIMHEEPFQVSKTCIETLLATPRNQICAIGTTSLRTLESLFWMAVQINTYGIRPDEPIVIPQDLCQTLADKVPQAFNAWQVILNWMQLHQLDCIYAHTALMIHPQYKIQTAGLLWTNFHQPRSTLLMLVEACIGPEWKTLYNTALKIGFKFLSYGDACLLYINER